MRFIHPILLIFLFSISVNAQSTKEEYFEFGKKLLEENYQSSAIECFDKAIQLDSNFAEAFYYRGLVFLVTYKSDFKLRAIKYDFERAISLKKENNFWKAYETLADLRFPRDSISLDYYDIAIRINPNNPNLYLK